MLSSALVRIRPIFTLVVGQAVKLLEYLCATHQGMYEG